MNAESLTELGIQLPEEQEARSEGEEQQPAHEESESDPDPKPVDAEEWSENPEATESAAEQKESAE